MARRKTCAGGGEFAPGRTIPVTEEESVKLLYACVEAPGRYVDLAFGPGWSGVKWPAGESMPWYVELLGRMRGVLNENTEGAGI